MPKDNDAKSVAQELERIREGLETTVIDMGKLMEKKEFQAVIDKGLKFANDWNPIERSGLSALFWKYMGLAHINVKDFDGASKCFDNADMLSPYDPEILVGKSMVSIAGGKFDEAIKLLVYALRADPHDAVALVFMSLCWGMKGDTTRAVSFIKMAADSDKKTTREIFDSLIESAYNAPNTTDSQRMELTKVRSQLNEVLSKK